MNFYFFVTLTELEGAQNIGRGVSMYPLLGTPEGIKKSHGQKEPSGLVHRVIEESDTTKRLNKGN